MNTHRTARTLPALLRTLTAAAGLALACQGALAADSEGGTDPAPPAPTAATTPARTPALTPALTPASQLVAQSLREAVVRQTATAGAQPRLGMHLVVRLAIVDVVSHPDSGDVDLTLRSRLLDRTIARKPLAVGVTWRF